MKFEWNRHRGIVRVGVIDLATKIAKIVPLRLTRWPLELKKKNLFMRIPPIPLGGFHSNFIGILLR